MSEAETSGVDNPYRYSTKEWDEKSGLYYFGARYYCLEVGHWTQRDPAGTADGLNLYCYVASDPVSAFDEWGMWTGRTPNVFELHQLNWRRCQAKFREAKRLLRRTVKRHETEVKAWLVQEKCLCKGEALPGLGDINLAPVPLPFGVATNPSPFGRSTRVTLFDCNFIADKKVAEIASPMMHEYVHQLCGGLMLAPFGVMIMGRGAENEADRGQDLVNPWLVE